MQLLKLGSNRTEQCRTRSLGSSRISWVQRHQWPSISRQVVMFRTLKAKASEIYCGSKSARNDWLGRNQHLSRSSTQVHLRSNSAPATRTSSNLSLVKVLILLVDHHLPWIHQTPADWPLKAQTKSFSMVHPWEMTHSQMHQLVLHQHKDSPSSLSRLHREPDFRRQKPLVMEVGW